MTRSREVPWGRPLPHEPVGLARIRSAGGAMECSDLSELWRYMWLSREERPFTIQSGDRSPHFKVRNLRSLCGLLFQPFRLLI